jgi:hypothetical protein
MRANLAVESISMAHGTGLVAGNTITHTDSDRNTIRSSTATRCGAW